MRVLGRLVLVLLVLGLGAWGVQKVGGLMGAVRFGQSGGEWLGLARPAQVYRLDARRWLRFPLTPGSVLARVITNAGLSTTDPADLDAIWSYAIEMQVLAEHDEVLLEQVYHHRAGLSRFMTGDQARSMSFYIGDRSQPLDGRILYLNLGDLPGARYLRLRLHTAPPPLTGGAVRVYQRQRLPDHKLGYLWQRLSPEQQANLTRGNVYGPLLLRADEKQALLRQRWMPVGPLGVMDSDYEARTLYTIREPEGERVSDRVLPQGLPIGPGRHGMVPVPEGVERLTLSFVTPAGDALAGGGASIHTRWYGEGPWARRGSSHDPSARGGAISLEVDGGLLEVSTDSPAVLRAFIGDRAEREEVTPVPPYLRTYLALPGQPVSYAVAHVDGAPTPFRLDLRRLTATGEWPAADGVASVRFLDRSGRVIREERLPLDAPPSLYDQVSSAAEASPRVSEPGRLYFHLPPEVHRLEITAAPGALLASFTRPQALERRQRIPEDYASSGRDEDRIPGWFLIQPEGREALWRERRTVLLTVQPRPPVDDPEIRAGRYRWQAFYPDGAWKGRHLMNPIREAAVLRDEALPARFTSLAPGRARELEFRGDPGRRGVSPDIAWDAVDGAPAGRYRLSLDGADWVSGEALTAAGTRSLPDIPVGSHTIGIRSENATTRWYVNRNTGKDAAVLRRLALRLGPDWLVFRYSKQTPDEEVLTGHFQAPVTDTGRVGIRVRVSGTEPRRLFGPFADWSFLERLYDLRMDPPAVVPVLQARGERVNEGRRFFLTLGSDLAVGEYDVRIRVEDGPAGYLTLYRLTPGDYGRRAWYRGGLEAPGTGAGD